MRTTILARALAGLIIPCVGLAGCAARYEGATRRDLEAVERAATAPGDGELEPEALDGSLESYLSEATRRSPSLRAAFARWRAAVERIPQARRLPEPVLGYRYLFQPLDGALGPGRHRLGVSQELPWPTRLTAGADAESAAARAAQRRFEAARLALARRVTEAWVALWRVEQVRRVLADQVQVLDALSATTRARVATGGASLADLQQVDLAGARVADRLAGLDEEQRAGEAALAAALGVEAREDLPVSWDAPLGAGLPAEDEAALREAARSHPRVEALATMAEASEDRRRAASAERLPGAMLGLEWMDQPGGADGGGDMMGVEVMVGVSLPLWQGAYGAAEEEARAEATAYEADAEDAARTAEAQVGQALAAVRDAERRIALYRATLIPQAQTAYEAVVGAYQVGGATIAATLRGQEDLLELGLGLIEAQVARAVAWARLEEAVGRPVAVAEGGAP